MPNLLATKANVAPLIMELILEVTNQSLEAKLFT